jgi:hypothetical protein
VTTGANGVARFEERKQRSEWYDKVTQVNI